MPSLVATKNTYNTSKLNFDGIEVANGIVWQGWEPGQEYTKNIILKNVKVKTQKLKYNVPSSRFFSTLYPQPIVLSAGTSYTLPVTFRPLEKNVYEDKIAFESPEGAFEVPIRAVLPQTDIVIPEHVNFNMCSAQDNVQLTFTIKNASELETPFEWDVKEPFTLEPHEGTLDAWGSCTIHATFSPKHALVYEADAICRYGNKYEERKSTRFEGIGKYPHLLVAASGQSPATLTKEDQNPTLNFGTIPLGKSSEKWVELHNLSPVRAPYKVTHPTAVSRIDTVFSCPQRSGVVPPMSAVQIPIIFSPNTIDASSVDYFDIIGIGNISKTQLKCTGASKGPKVTLTKKALNFFQIDSGQTGTKVVEIVNDSDNEATFKFMIDCNESVFKVDKLSGVLAPYTKVKVIILFKPLHPINYYRRIACVVHNQDPLFLDLLGTCHTETAKPAVLEIEHIERYRTHVERGFSMFPPEQLNELVKSEKLQIDANGALMSADAESLEAYCEPPSHITTMEEYFNDGYYSDVTHSVPHVSLDVHEADFGQCTSMRLVEPKTLNVTNHTKGKITVVWMGSEDHVFSVTPCTMDIPPLKTCSFRLSFKPTAANKFYGAELECYAYYKSLRDYRLVESTTHTPPWCLTLTTMGQTFMPNNETFLPRFDIDSPKLVFPAVNANEATYRTLAVANLGTTPILYEFAPDPDGIFSVKPTKGLLTEGYQMFVVKTLPKEVKTYRQTLKLRLNDADKNTQDILVWGSAESAEVVLENGGELYFKPTCVGTASHQNYSIKNVSRIPLRFEWKLNHKDAKLLSVHPPEGTILPNESQNHTWAFKPTCKSKFVSKPSLIVWGQGQSATSSAGKKKQFVLRVLGEGSLGQIESESTYIDFGNVVVGSSATQNIVLVNTSNCSLHYKLDVEQNVTGDVPDEVINDDSIALQLDRSFGILPARSKVTVIGTVRPMRRLCYQFAISYQLITSQEGNNIDPELSEAQHLCHILAMGVFPVMSITDARCYGSAIGISKKQLWNLFSLDNMNMCLDSAPSMQEISYSVASRKSHRRRQPVHTRSILDFNFSAAPVGAEPCVVQLMIENTGAVPTEWSFLYPKDLQLELEYWAETGEFDEDELHEMKVMDNKLFEITPKKGKLEPGECKTIKFSYKHDMAGTDRLPVLLKQTSGREILINFIGVTVEPERRYIHFPSNKFMFAPVAVGEKNSPKQVYELFNGGAVPVKYEIDTSPLLSIQQENFDHPVFECVNPQGEILPGRNAIVEWKFSPLEAKTYMADVPIQIHEGDTALITFTGVGYDKRALGETMPLTDQPDSTGVPGVQSVPIPGQLVFLSQERLSFGNVPLYAKGRQAIFVTNRSKDHTVSFEWHVTSQYDSQFVNIKPLNGSLQPGDSMMCRVSFTAVGVPSFYDLDLICEVTDETEMAKYNKKLAAWEKENERQKYEFTITENDLNADQRLPDLEERPRSGQLRSLDSSRSTTRSPMGSDSDLSKYRTLPPIKTPSIDREQIKKSVTRQQKEDYWQKPVAPDPFLLHLGVTARTHDITEFQNNFSEDYHKYYIDMSLGESLSGSDSKVQVENSVSPLEIECAESEVDLISGVLGNILRGLLDDSDFHHSIAKIKEEAIPYFVQIGTKGAVTPPPSEETLVPESTTLPSEKSMQSRLTQLEGETGRESGLSSIDMTLSPSISPTTPQTGSRVDAIPSSGDPPATPPPSKQKLLPSHRGHTREEMAQSFAVEKGLNEKQNIKQNRLFGSMLDSIVENAVLNIMNEAFDGEFNITARPRLVALPPKPNTPQGSKH
ncbi:unnamed protein product [Owenia fusiformis]|uniref:Uncharacterized protein n=1 Tax=Owenia fusiformis TaxID=6347 RepID=A0A8J1XSG1_OWEFU|nr:unnamed protein product [Owenia fusiformis]